MKLNPADQARVATIKQRNAAADAAYEAEMAPARLPLKDPNREPYTVVVPRAIAAYDKVIAKWRRLLWA